MKKIATMQDISCVGKCSLTVALPVISAMGIETAVIPTAVLSTHTMFQGFTFCDLTDQIEGILNHWEKEGFEFEAVYTGYLGSQRQIDIAKDLFARFAEKGIRLVDPCMADNGKLYAGFTPEFAKTMNSLCAIADIIVPNLTEASFLLDIPYQETYDEAYIRDVLVKLTETGAKKAILTGISFEEIRHFHGTGDIWASTFLGALVSGKSFEESIEIACDFVKEAIRLTLAEENHNEYGINFEQAFPYLLKRL